VTLVVEIPGAGVLRLEHLLLDVNGTLTNRGAAIAGVAERLAAIAIVLEPRILSADTFGTLDEVAGLLDARAERVGSGEEKAAVVAALGADRCAAIGNGANDAAMLASAALGIAVVGPEGAAGAAVRAADVVCTSILDALDLLLDERALVATLRR
jgi:soluble P-type ATPase